MKGRALLLVLLFLLSTVAVATVGSADVEETRSTGRVPVRLYIHLTATESSMDTEQGRTGGRTTQSLDIPSMELEDALTVQTVDTGIGENRGFETYLSVATVIHGATVPLSVL